jgi:hypothetical protein
MAIAFQPLTVTPVNFSLTAGTAIPAPLDSPPQTPVKSTSLPSIQEDGPDGEATAAAAKNTSGAAVAAPPLSPLSANGTSPARKFNGVRKFLSLRSLRGPDGTVHGRPGPAKLQLRAAHSSGKLSYDASRPGSPPLTALSADAGAAAAAAAAAPSSSGGGSSGALKHKRSAGWFGTGGGKSNRRRSALFFLGGGNHMDERVAETVKEITERKIRTGPPPPSIPEIKGLAATGGEGNAAAEDAWDVDGMFKDIK